VLAAGTRPRRSRPRRARGQVPGPDAGHGTGLGARPPQQPGGGPRRSPSAGGRPRPCRQAVEVRHRRSATVCPARRKRTVSVRSRAGSPVGPTRKAARPRGSGTGRAPRAPPPGRASRRPVRRPPRCPAWPRRAAACGRPQHGSRLPTAGVPCRPTASVPLGHVPGTSRRRRPRSAGPCRRPPIADLWAELFEIPRDQWDHDLIGWFLRTAYGQATVTRCASRSVARCAGRSPPRAPRRGPSERRAAERRRTRPHAGRTGS
jgi:hypothetical protein